MTKFVLSVFLIIAYFYLTSAQHDYFVYQQQTTPIPVYYAPIVDFVPQYTPVVYGPTRNNNGASNYNYGENQNGPTRDNQYPNNRRQNSAKLVPIRQTGFHQNAGIQQNRNTGTKRENNQQIINYDPGENYNDAAKGLGEYDLHRNTPRPIATIPTEFNQNSGTDQNQNTAGVDQNQNTDIVSNSDENNEPYVFLGGQTENTNPLQSATVQIRTHRYNYRNYPNPYNARQRPQNQWSNQQRTTQRGNQQGNPQSNQQWGNQPQNQWGNRQQGNQQWGNQPQNQWGNQAQNQWGNQQGNQNTFSQGENMVVTNNPYCTNIAKELIKQGGNVREVFIATSLCEGLVHPMDSGLGGGFLAVYYNFENGNANTAFIDSREKSPSSAKFTQSSTKVGGNSIAIPTVLSGYEAIYKIDQHKNRLQWAQIIRPVLNLCENGYFMSHTSKKMLQVLLGSFNRTVISSDIIKLPRFCQTLSEISLDGPSSSMYRAKGTLYKKLVQDLRYVNSTIKPKDIQKNRARIGQPSVARFDKYTMYSTKTPGSGQAMLFAMKIIERLRTIIPATASNDDKIVYLLKILKYTFTFQPHIREISEDKINKIVNEASQSLADGIVKAGFKLQNTIPTKFGDIILPKLQSPSQRGTTNIVIKIGKSAITASSSINSLYGSGIFSETMGFFYNNHLRDFSNPNWRLKDKPLKNVAGPDKVPSSAISPLIMVDGTTGEPVFQIGSAGGSHILSAMINTCFNYFIMNRSLKDSVAACRVMPKFNYLRNKVSYLYECIENEQSANRLRKIGIDFKSDITAGHAAVTTLSKLRGGKPEAVFDPRRGGADYIQ